MLKVLGIIIIIDSLIGLLFIAGLLTYLMRRKIDKFLAGYTYTGPFLHLSNNKGPMATPCNVRPLRMTRDEEYEEAARRG